MKYGMQDHLVEIDGKRVAVLDMWDSVENKWIPYLKIEPISDEIRHTMDWTYPVELISNFFADK